MDSQFIASAHTAAGALTRVATGTALKTLLQVGVPAGRPINILGWGCSFRGVAAADPPGELYLILSDVAATVTSLTPDTWRQPLEAASACVGGAALTGINATVEGTITSSILYDAQQIHPQTGYSCGSRRAGSRAARLQRDVSAVRVSCGSARELQRRSSSAGAVGATSWDGPEQPRQGRSARRRASGRRSPPAPRRPPARSPRA
jgi:hypothetical protein